MHKNESKGQFCLNELEVSERDLTTLGDAFKSCDHRLLLAALIDAELGWSASEDLLESPCGDVLLRKVSSTLNIMQTMSSASRGYDDSGQVEKIREATGSEPDISASVPCRFHMIVPIEHYKALDGRGRILRHVSAALVNVKHDLDAVCNEVPGVAKKIFERTHSIGQLSLVRKDIQTSSVPASLRYKALWHSVDALAFESWASALALRLWMPQSLSTYERYCVLAHVFWALTYFGFDQTANELRWGERLSARGNLHREIAHDRDNLYNGSDTESVDMNNSDFFFAEETYYDERYRAGDDLAERIAVLVELLNYNCWVDLIQALFALNDLNDVA